MLLLFFQELVGQKPRRVFVKAVGGTLHGLRASLQERLELPDSEFTITLDGCDEGHFVQSLQDLPSGSCAVHIDRAPPDQTPTPRITVTRPLRPSRNG